MLQGARIAEHPESYAGDIHALLSGKVTNITPASISIKTDTEDLKTEPVDISGIDPGKELIFALKSLGVDTNNLVRAKTLIINGFNPEPGISVYDQLLCDHQETLERGLELVRKLISPSSAILAVPGRSTAYLFGVFVTALIYFLIDETKYANPFFHLITESVIFGSFFLATDSASSPVGHIPMIYFGLMGGRNNHSGL